MYTDLHNLFLPLIYSLSGLICLFILLIVSPAIWSKKSWRRQAACTTLVIFTKSIVAIISAIRARKI